MHPSILFVSFATRIYRWLTSILVHTKTPYPQSCNPDSQYPARVASNQIQHLTHWTPWVPVGPLLPSGSGPSGRDPWPGLFQLIPAPTFNSDIIWKLDVNDMVASSRSLTKMINRTVLSTALRHPPCPVSITLGLISFTPVLVWIQQHCERQCWKH